VNNPSLPPELQRLRATVQDPLFPSCPSSVSTKILSQPLVQKLYPQTYLTSQLLRRTSRMVVSVHNLCLARRSHSPTSIATKISSFPSSHPRVVGTREGGHHYITVVVQCQVRLPPCYLARTVSFSSRSNNLSSTPVVAGNKVAQADALARIIAETQSGTDTGVCPNPGRTGTMVRILSIVRLEEVVADVAAETEAMARVEKGVETRPSIIPFQFTRLFRRIICLWR
jgi:hypothetical protein